MKKTAREAMWAKKNGSKSQTQHDLKQDIEDTTTKLKYQAGDDSIKVPAKDTQVVKLDKGSSALVSNSDKETKTKILASNLSQ